MGDDGAAVPIYEALLKLRPDHYYAANNLAIAARRLNRPDLILSAAQHIADQRPDDFLANAEAATRTVEQNRDPEAARRFIDRMHVALPALGRGALPHWASYFDCLPAYRAWQFNDVRQALGSIDRVTATFERTSAHDIGTGKGLVFWYLTLGRASEAMRLATRVDSATPPGQRFAGLRVIVADVIDDREQLRKTLDDDPGEAAPMFVRAGLFDDARRVVRLRLPDPLNRAWNEIAQGNFDIIDQRPNEAIAHLQAGLRTLQYLDDREYDRGCESMATALTMLGRHDDAIETLERCVRNRGRAANPAQSYRADGMHMALRLADEYRAAGRVLDAIPIEQRLRQLLAYADPDFPLAVRLRNRR
jgi:tetratricopeptide (TPR) repeat protein